MAEKPKETVEMAPDPEEDDLDDLDDVLDQFNAQPKASKPASTKPSGPSASGPGRPKDEPHELPDDADLQAQLQAGMKDLMGELDGNPEMQKEFEKMMAELVAAGQAGSDEEAMKHIGHATEAVNNPPGPETAEAKVAGSKKSGQSESFQDTIRKTMERMQGSSDSASAAAASGSENSEEALLAQMMAQLQAGGTGGEGGEEDFSKMLMSMMTQLTNKDILYEPMKELHDKFPPWLEKHKDEVEKADWERYLEQQKLVDDIVNRFERKEYSDDNEDDREYIVERMQKMQGAGSPPPDLVGDMSAAQEALGELDSGCPTQ